MSQLWLHIGTQKTGSTSIQHFCRAGHEFLREAGIGYVHLGRRSSVNKLAKAMRRQDARRQTQMGNYLEGKIGQAANWADHVVMSSEMFCSRGVSVERLKQLLPSANRMPLNIVVYLRRQDRYFESLYRQRVKNGFTQSDFAGYFGKAAKRYGNYLELVERWQTAFPKARMHVRRFDRGHLTGADVIDDFLSLFGISDIPEELRFKSANTSPGADAIELFRALSLAGGYRVNEVFDRLEAAAPAISEGRLLSADEARHILSRFAHSNEEIRKRFFPNDAVLFDTSDLDAGSLNSATFTRAQKAPLTQVFRAISEIHIAKSAA